MADASSPGPTFFNIADEFISRPAREHPQKTAILRPAGAFSYAALESTVNRVAQALRDSGCQPSERVLIALPDSLEFVAAFFGAAKVGAIAVPVNPMARSTDYRHYLENSGACFAMVDAPILGEFAAGAAAQALNVLVVCNQTAGTERPERVARRVLAWHDWLPTLAEEVKTHPTSATDAAFFPTTASSRSPNCISPTVSATACISRCILAQRRSCIPTARVPTKSLK